jgi:hypothetical protein
MPRALRAECKFVDPGNSELFLERVSYLTLRS